MLPSRGAWSRARGKMKPKKPDEQIKKIREGIIMGSIDFKELKAAIRALGFEIQKEELQKIIAVIADGSGEIEFPEFMQILMTGKMGASNEEIMKLFKRFDAQGKGYIDFGDVKAIAKELGDRGFAIWRVCTVADGECRCLQCVCSS